MSKYHEAIAAAWREPADYGWIVDHDHLADEFPDLRSEVGVMGPSDIPDELVTRLNRGQGVRWRMFDDDGELYYTGRLVTLDGTDEPGFGPLDDFGTGNAGCTRIDYHIGNGRWETL